MQCSIQMIYPLMRLVCFLGLGALSGDGRVHPHSQHPHCADQDPALLPKSAEPGPGTRVPSAQDLPGGEGEEA